MASQTLYTLGELTDAFNLESEGIKVTISSNWMQGRTAFGGITGALSLAAARRAETNLPTLRSAQVSFLRPVSEDTVFKVELVRAGRTSSFVRVDCISGGKLSAQVGFVFGADRPSKHTHETRPPTIHPAPESCPLFADGGFVPEFFQNFEMRQAAGDALVSGSNRPFFAVWSRLHNTDNVSPEITLMCLADSLPPAAMTGFEEPAPISTITWSIDFVGQPEPVDWILIEVSSKFAASGYSLQDMTLRAPCGKLIASAQQMVALFD